MSINKKKIYVGGLDASVNEELLFAAFIPFGDIREVTIAKDPSNNRPRGFGFVDFEEADDAAAAIENMNGAEIMGKYIKCTLSRPATKLKSGQAIWTTEEFFKSQVGEGEGEETNVEE